MREQKPNSEAVCIYDRIRSVKPSEYKNRINKFGGGGSTNLAVRLIEFEGTLHLVWIHTHQKGTNVCVRQTFSLKASGFERK